MVLGILLARADGCLFGRGTIVILRRSVERHQVGNSGQTWFVLRFRQRRRAECQG